MILKRFFVGKPRDAQALALYETIVAQARRPALYQGLGVPDSLDGRFEAIVLHLVLVLRRLKRDFPDGRELAAGLQEAFFEDMDRSLREMGAGDLGVGKRVKRMAEGFAGRLASYEAALDGGPVDGGADGGAVDGGAALGAALRRNVFGTLPAGQGDLAGLTAYTLAQAAALDGQAGSALRHGRVAFAEAFPESPEKAGTGAEND